MLKTTLDGKVEPQKVTWSESTQCNRLVLSAPGQFGQRRIILPGTGRDAYEDGVLALARAGTADPLATIRHQQPEAFEKYMAANTGRERPGHY